jgi:hypothetical protein
LGSIFLLSDEANLKSLQFGWLVFGIRNKDKNIDIRDLLFNKLPDVLTVEQKDIKIRNILHNMNRNGIIKRNSSNRRTAFWFLQ